MSKIYTPYDNVSGLFLGSQYSLDESDLLVNTPTGCTMLEGAYDHLAVQVDIQTGEVVERTTPPDGRNTVDWTFDEVSRRWQSRPNAVVRSIIARKRRDKLLAESDTAITIASERGIPPTREWVAYRQALRDLPTRPDFPDIADWPVKPNSI